MEEVKNLESNFAGSPRDTKEKIDRILDMVMEEAFTYPPPVSSRSISMMPEEIGATSANDESDARDFTPVKELQYDLVKARKLGALAMQNQIRRDTKKAVNSLEMQVKFADFFLEARKAIDSFDIPPVVDLTDVKKEYKKLKEDFKKRQKLIEFLERRKTCQVSQYVDNILKKE